MILPVTVYCATTEKKGHAEICSAFICETKHNFKFMFAPIKVLNELALRQIFHSEKAETVEL